MKIVMISLLVPLLAACCHAQVAGKRSPQPKCEPYIYERLRNYFDINEEKPTQVINNTKRLEPWQSRTQKITIGDHSIEWIDEVSKNDSRSSVRINGESITLADKVTSNKPDGDQTLYIEHDRRMGTSQTI